MKIEFDRERIFLKIVGYTFQIDFFISKIIKKEYGYKNILKEKIESFYNYYLLKSKPKKVDFKIKIYHSRPQFLPYEKDESKYLLYFLQIKDKEITTYDFLSLGLFNEILLRFALSYLLSKDGGFFLHCSGNLVGGEAVLFLGKSGAGKSTITRIAHKQGFPSIADDGVIIREIKGQPMVFTLPPFEKKDWLDGYFTQKENRGYRLKALYFIKQSKKNFVKPVHKKDLINKLPSLLYNIGIFDKKKNFLYILKILNYFKKFNILYFNKRIFIKDYIK